MYNPLVWAGWHGDEEHRTPAPEFGYAHELYELTTFDPMTCTATDTWWDAQRPDEKISQTLRCYTPADLALLVGGTGLAIASITPEQLWKAHSYLAVLRPE